MSESRLKTLHSVHEMLEKMRKDWEHIDSGEQALRAARDEIGTWIEAAQKFRVTLSKRTVAGYAVGVGTSREEAQKEAMKFFQRDISRSKPDRIYVERFEGRYVEVECLEATGGGYVSKP